MNKKLLAEIRTLKAKLDAFGNVQNTERQIVFIEYCDAQKRLGELEMKPKAPRPGTIYLALHEDCLRNGSFYRNSFRRKWACYINGDFMGCQDEKPDMYAGGPLVEYPKAVALKLIPSCCK